MRRCLHEILAVATAIAVWTGASPAQTSEPDWPERLTIGTASAGGTYQAYGEAIARVLSRSLGLPVLTRPSGGPSENINLIEAGEIEIGFVTLAVAQQGWTGSGDWTGGKPLRSMRALFPMYNTPFQFIVPASSPAVGLADLRGKRVGIGPAGGTSGTYSPRIFKTLGIAADFGTGSYSEMAGELAGGKLDSIVVAGGVPMPEIAALDKQTNVRSLPLTPSQIVALRLAMPELSQSFIAAGSYPSLRRHYPTVGTYNFAVAHYRIPESLAYAILEAVFSHREELAAAHPAAAETIPEKFMRNAILPFHPGAARWYKNNAVTGVVLGD